jgi:hypothetical protein
VLGPIASQKVWLVLVAKRGDPRVNRAYRYKFRNTVLARDNFVCHYCGGDADQVDHVIPVSKAPELVLSFDNAVACCKRCNVQKGNKSQGVFLASKATTTFREVANAIENTPELKKDLKKILYTNGNEAIILKSGARLDVRAATRDSARGATADFLFVDELREVDQEAFAAALPVTRAKPNSQTLLASNAGDAFSTTLNELRERCQSNPPPSLGYYEYSAPPFCALDDRKAWAAANPALGILITEETLQEALTVQTTEQFRTESLSQWIDSLQSPWPFGSVEDSSDINLKMSPGPLTVFAFDISPSRRDSSLVMGQLLPNGKIGLAVLETYSSQVAVDEVLVAASIKKWADMYYPRLVCYDKYTTASIAQRLQNAGVQTRDISGQSFYTACSDMYDALVNDRLRHSGQESLIQQMANCAAKQTPDAWRIVRRKSAGPVDIPIGLAMVIHILAQPVAEAKVYA